MKSRGMGMLSYVLPVALGLAALLACTGEGGGGCGRQQATTCGEGTKKIQSGNGYKCVPNS